MRILVTRHCESQSLIGHICCLLPLLARQFPSRAGCLLVVEGRLGREGLATDPVLLDRGSIKVRPTRAISCRLPAWWCEGCLSTPLPPLTGWAGAGLVHDSQSSTATQGPEKPPQTAGQLRQADPSICNCFTLPPSLPPSLLQVYALDKASNVRQLLGYALLDIRTARVGEQVHEVSGQKSFTSLDIRCKIPFAHLFRNLPVAGAVCWVLATPQGHAHS